MKTQEIKKNEPRFRGEVVDLDSTGLTYDFSTDGQAATLVFSKLQIDVGDKSKEFVATRTASLAIPVVHNDRNLRITQGISGFVDVDSPARAVLLVQAAGETTLVNLEKAKDDGQEQENAYSFIETIEGELQAGAAYHITFFLLVERDIDHCEAGALLTIDSLDLEIKEPDGEG
jgi:hypothetical protein